MSDYIEIDKKPVIFDDPEYCESSGQICGFCNKYECKCNFFSKIIREKFYTNLRWCRKCDECKTAWKTAKEKQKLTPCDNCGKTNTALLFAPAPIVAMRCPFE